MSHSQCEPWAGMILGVTVSIEVTQVTWYFLISQHIFLSDGIQETMLQTAELWPHYGQ